MDRLSMNAMLAEKAGMSYGRWMALQPVIPIVKPEIPEGAVKCEGCGMIFFTKSKKRFCDEVCRRQSYERKKREERERVKSHEKT